MEKVLVKHMKGALILIALTLSACTASTPAENEQVDNPIPSNESSIEFTELPAVEDYRVDAGK
jgi:hypothetical protein